MFGLPPNAIAAIRVELESEDPRTRTPIDALRTRRDVNGNRTHTSKTFAERCSRFWISLLSHANLAEQMADAVTQHATPVGSGTVARTQRIPIERRAESAVIAWLRHQTTAYDNMKIARVKGKRREVRRMLAEQSRRLLEKYRAGRAVGEACPLRQALLNSVSTDGD